MAKQTKSSHQGKWEKENLKTVITCNEKIFSNRVHSGELCAVKSSIM